MTHSPVQAEQRFNRRHILLGGTGLAAAGALGGWHWWEGYPDLQSADHAATTLDAQFDLGLVGIDQSGWTRPEGLAPVWPRLTQDVDTDVLVVGAGLAGSSLAMHMAEAGTGVVLIDARQPG